MYPDGLTCRVNGRPDAGKDHTGGAKLHIIIFIFFLTNSAVVNKNKKH